MAPGRGTLMLPAAHVGASDLVAQRAEAALQRLVAFRSAWPTPSAGHGVRADAVLRVLKHLAPLAEMVAKLPVGHEKLGYPGADHLTGDIITDDDRLIANYLKEEVADRLERTVAERQLVLDAQRYGRLKEAAYRLLMVATDLDLGDNALEKTGGEATKTWSKLASLAVVPLDFVKAEVNVGAEDTVEIALTRLERVMARWPRPKVNEGVMARAVLDALEPLLPLARMILDMPDDTRKHHYPGAGYLSGGPTLTEANRAIARAVLTNVKEILPRAGEGVLTRTAYNILKQLTHRLLMLAADFDVESIEMRQAIADGIGGMFKSLDLWAKTSPIIILDEQAVVGAMAVLNSSKADADLARLMHWTNSFPKCGTTPCVRADRLLGALTALEPLAAKIAGMKDGALKGGYSGGGYLSGPTITTDDKAVANRILYETRKRLPTQGTGLVTRDLLEQIRGVSQRLLMIACDLNLDETLLDKASRGWDAYSAALVQQVFESQQKGYAKLVNQTKYAAMRIAEADEAADAAAEDRQ